MAKNGLNDRRNSHFITRDLLAYNFWNRKRMSAAKTLKAYWVNKKAQANGDHEVHEAGCPYLPLERVFLGDFYSCYDAIKVARKVYKQVDGCYHCSNPCHKSWFRYRPFGRLKLVILYNRFEKTQIRIQMNHLDMLRRTDSTLRVGFRMEDFLIEYIVDNFVRWLTKLNYGQNRKAGLFLLQVI